MSFFRKLGNVFEKTFIRPVLKPAVTAAVASVAPWALPLVQGVLSPTSPEAVAEDPGGYFPSPTQKVDMAHRLWDPWDLGGIAETAGHQVGRRIRYSEPEFFDDDFEEDFVDEEEE
jgi:hypothetical protein